MCDRRISIDQLARELGLAKSTVSRALNGYPDIAEATRARVRAAADARGYRPSSLARRLKSGRVETVGLVLSDPSHHLDSPHLAAFLTGVSAALDRRGLDLLLATAPARARWREVYDRLIAARKVDAFLLIRTESRDPRVGYLRERGVPFVAHGRTECGGPFAWFDLDNRRAGAEAARRLAGLGHRRIGFVGGPERYNFARQRREGYLDGLSAAGLTPDPALVREAGLDAESGEAATLALLTLDRPPTALVCVVDAAAFGAMRALRALGLTAGRDVSLIGYDDVPMAAVTDPPLTTFNQASADAGGAVAAMLARLLAGEQATRLRELRPAVMIRRASDAPPVHAPETLRARIDARRGNRGELKGREPCDTPSAA